MWERSVTLRRLNSIRRQNVEWGMEDLTCGSGFQIHGNWWRGLMRKEFLLQSAKVAEEDQTYATSYLGMKGNAAEERKVLGLNWDIIRDTFILRFDWLVRFTKELPPTKRWILRTVGKLYDPLRFMSPLFTAVKILSQDLCKLKTDWDEPLCDQLNFKYTKWLSDLMKVHSISIDRCCFFNVRDRITTLQIHSFGDSSEIA